MSAGAVREEDAYDVARVNAWLREHGDPEVVRALEGEPQVRQFDSGASNLTYELRWPTRALVLRRPPHGALGGSAHNMHREHDLQAALRPVFPHVPRMVGLCTDPEVLGSDFYVMDKLEGTIVGRDLPDDLLVGTANHDLGLARRFHRDAFRDRIVDRVRQAHGQIDDLALG